MDREEFVDRIEAELYKVIDAQMDRLAELVPKVFDIAGHKCMDDCYKEYERFKAETSIESLDDVPEIAAEFGQRLGSSFKESAPKHLAETFQQYVR